MISKKSLRREACSWLFYFLSIVFYFERRLINSHNKNSSSVTDRLCAATGIRRRHLVFIRLYNM